MGIGMFLAILVRIIDVYTLLIFVYVLMSWLPQKRGVIADIDNVLGKICEPYLGIFRKFIPPIGGVVDISPIIAIVALQLVIRLLYLIF